MAEYLKGDVKYTVADMLKVREVKKLPKSYRHEKGTVFSKQYSNTAQITTTEPKTWAVGISESDIENYSMFNRLRVINNSSVNIQVRFNGSTDTNLQVQVPTQTMAIWGKDDKKIYKTVEIYNDSTTTDVEIGEITVNISRVNE